MASSRPPRSSSIRDPISSIRNPRVVRLRSLAQRRQRLQARRFATEGLQTLEMALDAGTVPLELFFAEAHLGARAHRVLRRALDAGATPVAVSPDLMERLSDRRRPETLIATFPFVDRQLEALRVCARDLLLVADRLAKPSNIGMLIRSADAVGARAVILIGPHADVFDPLSLRASMGSVFNVPVVLGARAADVLRVLRRAHVPIVGADAHSGERFRAGGADAGLALVLGNEVHGLGPELRAAIDRCVRLPMLGRADSLNVAVAGSVLMYLWLEANDPLRPRGPIQGER